MLNFPVPRRQSDGLQKVYSDAAATNTTDMPDLARQEFKDEADVNVLLRKYGINVPQRQTKFGAIDTNMGLQDALIAVEQAHAAWRDLPANLKERYPTWQALINAVESGQLKLDMSEPTEESSAERLARITLEREEQRAKDAEILAAARARNPEPTS